MRREGMQDERSDVASARLRTVAVRDNAEWCDAMARAHGRRGQFSAMYWLCGEPMPQHFPNVVTIGRDVRSQRGQHEAIARLAAAGLPRGWAVKDSYACLDLTMLGFRALLDAEWYARMPGPIVQPQPAGSAPLEVAVVRGSEAFAAWVAAWRAATSPAATPAVAAPMAKRGGRAASAKAHAASVFPLRLLDDPSVRIVSARDAERVRAGLVAMLGGSVIGISNAFGSADGVDACIAALARGAPQATLVGWGDETELAQRIAFGFRALGRLRIWVEHRRG